MTTLQTLSHGRSVVVCRPPVDPRGIAVLASVKQALESHQVTELTDLAQLPHWIMGHDATSSLAVIVGGDGMMLSAARVVAENSSALPILGINTGQVGFLSDCLPDDVPQLNDEICQGEFVVEQRDTLAVSLRDHVYLAANEAHFGTRDAGRIISIVVEADDAPLFRLRADGILVSTPTGSSAYALAAGGPLVHPSVAAFSVVPICAQVLGARPVVVGRDTHLSIAQQEHERGYAAALVIDGHKVADVGPDDVVRISRGNPWHLVRHKSRGFFETCRVKLGWAERLR